MNSAAAVSFRVAQGTGVADDGPEGLEIEPAEKEFLHADFVVSADVEIVELYFYLKNKSKDNKQLGWQLIEILNIKDEVHENV